LLSWRFAPCFCAGLLGLSSLVAPSAHAAPDAPSTVTTPNPSSASQNAVAPVRTGKGAIRPAASSNPSGSSGTAVSGAAASGTAPVRAGNAATALASSLPQGTVLVRPFVAPPPALSPFSTVMPPIAASQAGLQPVPAVQVAPSGSFSPTIPGSVGVPGIADARLVPNVIPGAPPMLLLPDFASLVDRVGPAVVNIRTTQRVPLMAAGRRSRRGGSADDSARSGAPDGSDNSGGDAGSARGGDGASSNPSDDMSQFFKRFFGIPLPPGMFDKGRSPGGSAPDSAPAEVERDNGVGSGFILSADGFVMTNAHVVQGADAIYVTLTDRRQYKARLIGVDKLTDVAVVKIDAKNLPTVTIGDSSDVRVGEWVLAIGSPFGLESTVTAGIVSAKSRYTGEYLPFIQTDVAVNPGNSGGPLIDLQGNVIGINSQIYSNSGGFQGISFSIPVDEAMRVADQLEKSGVVTRGRIGVMIGPVTSDVAEALNLPRAEGALVTGTVPDSPARKGGLLPGDIILNYDGRAIDQYGELPRMVGAAVPGTDAPLTVWRKGRTRTLTVTVAQQENVSGPMGAAARPETPTRALTSNPLGLRVADLNDVQARAVGSRNGVQVLASEGPSLAAGIMKGDILLRVGDVDITDQRQFDALAARQGGDRPVALLVQRGDLATFVPVVPRAVRH
jgi:serine protease Do